MRLTDRDRKLIEDVALHQVMSRDQILRLGYFNSIPRVNARLTGLVGLRLLKRLEFAPTLRLQCSIYTAGRRARDVVEPRVAALLSARLSSVRHLEHAMAVIDTRIRLAELGALTWLAECQARHRYTARSGGRSREEDVRPDGVALFPGITLFIEVDQGSTNLARIREKCFGFDRYVRGGPYAEVYAGRRPILLWLTSGRTRKASLGRQIPKTLSLDVAVVTGKDLAAARSLGEVLAR